MRTKRRILIGLALAGVGTVVLATGTGAVTPTDWIGYLHSTSHDSDNQADTSITAANASRLVQAWTWRGDAATMPGQPNGGVFSSPTVANGSIYIGANNGYFYMLNATTGAVQHKVFIGFRPKLTCSARGFISTATVAPDPVSGVSTVYISGPDGYMYAFNASDLSLRWKSVIDIPSPTVNDYFQWSSPTVANGKIYVGSASHCDKPLTRGAVVEYDQATGNELARFYTVPAGLLGGGVWSSVAVDPQGNVYATSGTQPKNLSNHYDSVSIIKLDGNTLQKLGSFIVPKAELGGDGDFGSSPTIFGNYVGACNKNGIFYALNRSTMSLAWKVRLGAKSNSNSPAQCSSAAIWDGTWLYYAGNQATISGTSYRGSVRKIDPATGAFTWQRGLPNSVIGSPSLNGAGLIAAGTFDSTNTPNAVYLVDASTGAIVRTFSAPGGKFFSQPVFADGWLYTGNTSRGLTAYRLP
jgi:outer membrane protein assembly factor BamB